MTLAVTVGLFAYGGLWLDERLGTRPWMLLLLVFCGIIGGMLHLVRVVAPDMWPFEAPAKKAERDPKPADKSAGKPAEKKPAEPHADQSPPD